MHPVLAVIRLFDADLPVWTYGAFLAAAVIIGCFLLVRSAHRARADLGGSIAASGMITAGAFAGAFVVFVAEQWISRGGSLLDTVRQGGLAYFGAALGGTAAAAFACRLFGLPFGKLADLSVPAIAVSHAVGRLGCFFGGCCYGRPWSGPLSVAYSHPLAPAAHPSVLRHPVPLYECAGLLVLGLGFALISPGHIGKGRRFLSFYALYAAGRVALETFRGDATSMGLPWAGWMTVQQTIALAMVAACLSALAIGRSAVVGQKRVLPKPGNGTSGAPA